MKKKVLEALDLIKTIDDLEDKVVEAKARLEKLKGDKDFQDAWAELKDQIEGA